MSDDQIGRVIDEVREPSDTISVVIQILAVVASHKGGTTFINMLVIVKHMLLLNVNLPTRFYEFINLFSRSVLEFIPNPFSKLNSVSSSASVGKNSNWVKNSALVRVL
jgi:hypothetical protein